MAEMHNELPHPDEKKTTHEGTNVSGCTAAQRNHQNTKASQPSSSRTCSSANCSPKSANSCLAMIVLRSRMRHLSLTDKPWGGAARFPAGLKGTRARAAANSDCSWGATTSNGPSGCTGACKRPGATWAAAPDAALNICSYSSAARPKSGVYYYDQYTRYGVLLRQHSKLKVLTLAWDCCWGVSNSPTFSLLPRMKLGLNNT